MARHKPGDRVVIKHPHPGVHPGTVAHVAKVHTGVFYEVLVGGAPCYYPPNAVDPAAPPPPSPAPDPGPSPSTTTPMTNALTYGEVLAMKHRR